MNLRHERVNENYLFGWVRLFDLGSTRQRSAF